MPTKHEFCVGVPEDAALAGCCLAGGPDRGVSTIIPGAYQLRIRLKRPVRARVGALGV